MLKYFQDPIFESFRNDYGLKDDDQDSQLIDEDFKSSYSNIGAKWRANRKIPRFPSMSREREKLPSISLITTSEKQDQTRIMANQKLKALKRDRKLSMNLSNQYEVDQSNFKSSLDEE